MTVGTAAIVNKNSVCAATIATVPLANVLVAKPVVIQKINVIADCAEIAVTQKETVDALVKRIINENKMSSYSRAAFILLLLTKSPRPIQYLVVLVVLANLALLVQSQPRLVM